LAGGTFFFAFGSSQPPDIAVDAMLVNIGVAKRAYEADICIEERIHVSLAANGALTGSSPKPFYGEHTRGAYAFGRRGSGVAVAGAEGKDVSPHLIGEADRARHGGRVGE
jgi:hypothetical protein